jgi:hypothetical protein
VLVCLLWREAQEVGSSAVVPVGGRKVRVPVAQHRPEPVAVLIKPIGQSDQLGFVLVLESDPQKIDEALQNADLLKYPMAAGGG